ncbi:MAG: hypothetical protein KAW12_10910 [Candidatus Aminicenantes bacterium]|nr:hypothetical protein [Candidatus Aminicenantes bacterium]
MRKKIKVLILISILVVMMSTLLVGWSFWFDPCNNDRCDSARKQSCTMLCRIHDGCASYTYYGGCYHGMCQFYVTFKCENGEDIEQIVICSGTCPI